MTPGYFQVCPLAALSVSGTFSPRHVGATGNVSKRLDSSCICRADILCNIVNCVSFCAKMGSTKNETAAAPVKPTPKPYGTIVLTLKNCLLPDEKLAVTPSQTDGLDRDTETDLRIYGCELIQTAGILLKLPQVSVFIAVFEQFCRGILWKIFRHTRGLGLLRDEISGEIRVIYRFVTILMHLTTFRASECVINSWFREVTDVSYVKRTKAMWVRFGSPSCETGCVGNNPGFLNKTNILWPIVSFEG